MHVSYNLEIRILSSFLKVLDKSNIELLVRKPRSALVGEIIYKSSSYAQKATPQSVRKMSH